MEEGMNGIDEFVAFLNGIKERGAMADQAVGESAGDPQAVSAALGLGLEKTMRSPVTPMFAEEDRGVAEAATHDHTIVDKMKDSEALAERLGKFITEGS